MRSTHLSTNPARRLHDRQVRRARGRRQVTLVTQLVAVCATALAVLAGIVFAQQADSTTGTSNSGGDTSGSTGDTDGATSDGTDDGGAWPLAPVPGADTGGSGPAHGSSGAS